MTKFQTLRPPCVASVDGVVDTMTRRRREFDSAQVSTAVATASIGLRLEGLRVERLLSLEASPIVLSVSRVGSSEMDWVFVEVRVESLREASQPGVVSVLLLKNVSMPDELERIDVSRPRPELEMLRAAAMTEAIMRCEPELRGASVPRSVASDAVLRPVAAGPVRVRCDVS